jgi:hypothetical protein
LAEFTQRHKRLLKLREILDAAGIEPPYGKESIEVGMTVVTALWEPTGTIGRPRLSQLIERQSWAITAWFRAANFLGVYDDNGELWDPPEESWRLAMRQASLYFSELDEKRPFKTLERHVSQTRLIFDQFNYEEGTPFWDEIVRLFELDPPAPAILLEERYRTLRKQRGPKPL